MPSYFVYVMPVVVVAFVIWTIIARRRGMANTQHATVGALAQRLGLTLIEGDPTLNLYYLSQPNRNYKRSIKLAGAPYGRNVTFDFSDGTKARDFLVVVHTTYTWGCFLVVPVAVPFPDFEIKLKNPNQYLVPETMLKHLPEVPTGDPAIDSAYRVAVADPRYAPSMVPALRALAGQLYVHVVGQGGVVMIPITRFGLSYFVNAAEQYLFALEVLACTLEGRQPPATLAAPGAAPIVPGQRSVPQNHASPWGR